MKPSEINPDAWAEGVIHARCEVGGTPADPWTLSVGDSPASGESERLEIRLPAEVLRFELGQSGIQTRDHQELMEFVRADIEKNRSAACGGYLGILRGVLKPQKRPTGLLQRIFSSNSRPEIKWVWTSTENVGLVGPVLVIGGKVVSVR